MRRFFANPSPKSPIICLQLLKSVIEVTEAFNHSNYHIFNALQACDCVIGKKTTFWGKGEQNIFVMCRPYRRRFEASPLQSGLLCSALLKACVVAHRLNKSFGNKVRQNSAPPKPGLFRMLTEYLRRDNKSKRASDPTKVGAEAR